MKLSKNEKIMIIFGFLVVLFYIYTYFDLDKFFNAIVFISNKEDFFNPFKPNKIFRYNNKIYLLDTRNILEKNENPKVFNNFKEYQNFILQLEKEYSSELNLKIKKNEDIQDLILKKDIKLNNEDPIDGEPFYMSKKCNKQASFNSYNKNNPFYDKINVDKSRYKTSDDFDLISNNKFKEFEDMIKNQRSINKECEELKSKGKVSEKCKKFDFYKYNENLMKEINFEINKKRDFDNYNKMCLLEDTFRENMLEFEF